MAQKDKVKELVGRGLNSYHTKSLQQIDRIEKKNKEQNHKISILSNELDNDYLTKTEEGSVISLEHSKEGMVYLDELQGNTLVNYCTDGSKEMTLNGDIDVEGVSVTTTEGVDNGKVDVMCEGNTLVNLVKDGKAEKSFAYDGNSTNVIYSLIKKGVLNQQYTLICKLTNPNSIKLQISIDEGWTVCGSTNLNGFLKINILPTTINEPKNGKLMMYIMGEQNGLKISDCMLLEGDWTNREIPSYFEGMKSVGQDNENGHKIEILSQNKNLCTVSSYSGVRHNKIESNIPCKKNTVYTLTFKDESDLNQSGNRGITLITHKTKTDKNDHGNIYTHATNEGGKEYTFRKSGFTFNTSDCCYISLTSNNMSSVPNLIIKEIQIEEGSQTSYNPQMFNKKEILMNEPLRGLPNGVKDRFVKIGGKWYIERNTEELDMGSVTFSTYALSDEHPDVFGFYYTPSNIIQIGSDNRCICNILPSVYCAFPGIINHNIEGIDVSGSHIKGTIYRSKLTELSSNGLKKYFNEVGAKVLYPLRTPIYEPLEINPELLTYLDATHISNNSLIPCNMKIKNSGYNAIIKPSTLYTITLDTNKSGTIGMNLGGVKGTTTNNVLTLTTPATLTDDSLRLYGKGIKGSKVRLLEGDKTNWIPSHFEGMMSSFEDKFDTTDNTYKMEILSNNKNLLDLNDLILTSYNDHTVEKITNGFKIKSGLNGQWIIVAEFKLRVKPNTSYTLGITKTVIKNAYEGKDSTSWDVGYTWIKTEDDATITEFKLNDNLRNTKTFNTRNNTVIRIRFTTATDKPTTIGEYDFTDISLVEDTVNSKHTQNKYNKIQFSSIEPLRSTKDISDRFIFKDGKIMIERNCIERDLTYFKFSTTEIKGLNLKGGITISDAYRQPQGGANTTMKCDKLASDFKENTIPCINIYHHANQNELRVSIPQRLLKTIDKDGINDYFVNNPHKVIYRLAEPTYEEIPFELQKIILEGYENGTLFFDTNIPPTSTVTYAGETPIVKSVRLNKTEVLNNTNDINDNIVPYLMDMDYRVVCLQLQSENINDGVSMARLFGGAYEMLQRDIQSRRYSVDEYRHRLDAYLGANKITEDEYNKLGDMLNE